MALLTRDIVEFVRYLFTFPRNLFPPTSILKVRDNRFPWNDNICQTNYTTSHSRRLKS